MSDPFEDFAESFNLYLNHYAVFKMLAGNNKNLQKKYEYMQKLFDNRYLKADTTQAIAMQDDPKVRVWDTTKGF